MNHQYLRPRWIHSLMVVVLWSLPFAAAARGELITFKFSGAVTSVAVQQRPQLQGVDFPDVGDPFTGFYTFDSTALDGYPENDRGSFITAALLDKAVEVSVGEFQFEGFSSRILTNEDRYGVIDWDPPIELTSDPSLAEYLNRVHFSLSINKPNLLPDPNILPLAPPSLAGAQGFLTMLMDSSDNTAPGDRVTIHASLDSIRVIPEPTGAILAGLGLLFASQVRARWL